MIPGAPRPAKLIRQGERLGGSLRFDDTAQLEIRPLLRLIQIRRFKTVSLRYEPR
jgi:hypothetical protein